MNNKQIPQAESEQVAVRNPFASRCYTMSESHLSGHRLIVGFEKLEDAQAAHEWVARCGRGDSTHPAPGVPNNVAQDAQRYRWLRRKACVIGKTTYCGEETGQPILDFVNLPDVTEVIRRDSASTLDAAIDAAMLAASPAQKG